jgi:hypothetical protein
MGADYYSRYVPLAGGERVKAVLTYGLDPRPTPKRSILLATFYEQLLSKHLEAYWKQLTRETQQMFAGHFHQDKDLVRRIRESPDLYPHLGVVVHHFGPVPALLTDIQQKEDIHGSTVDARVALYYWRPKDNSGVFDGLFPNKQVFLQSLQGNYAMVMQRYFEDVAQVFTAIVRQSSLSQAFEWAKKAEETVGKSIQSKLVESVPGVAEWRKFRNDELNGSAAEAALRCNLFQEHYANVLLAKEFRNTALYFVNELYTHIGLESRSKEYLGNMTEDYVEFDRLQGDGFAQTLIDNSDTMTQLGKVRQFYRERDLEGLNRLHGLETWLLGVIEFAKFLLNLQHNFVAPTKARIFLSYNQGVDSSEHLKNQIKNYLDTHFKENLKLLNLEPLPAGAVLRDTIKARIWLADKLLIIVPKDTTKLGQDEPGSLAWLAKEAEHGLLLEKSVTYLREKNYDRAMLESALGNKNMEFLSPDAAFETPLPSGRATRVLMDFKDKIQIDFSPAGDGPAGSWEDLKKDMQTTLKDLAADAIRTRHRQLVKGFISQFPPDTLITLKNLYRIFGNKGRKTRQEIESLLEKEWNANAKTPHFLNSKRKSSFLNAWNNIRKRAFVVEGRRYHLIESEREGSIYYYLLSFDRLLSALNPAFTKEEVKLWRDDLLRPLPS